MPEDDAKEVQETVAPAATLPSHQERSKTWHDVFSLPAPVKRVFENFPLIVYPANQAPARAPTQRDAHRLHVFISEDGAAKGAPSFNPTCLKWQAYLKFSGIDFRPVPSNNHASPSGALPFLISRQSSVDIMTPVPSKKLQTWTKEQGKETQEPDAMKAEIYTALLDHRIRRAWLYILYVQQENYEAVAKRLYVDSASANVFVRATISHQLRQAALTELRKSGAGLSREELLRDGKEAFEALGTLLGQDEWFFGSARPGLFDASVFAYTHLLLDGEMGWRDTELGDTLAGQNNLIDHRDRILRSYF